MIESYVIHFWHIKVDYRFYKKTYDVYEKINYMAKIFVKNICYLLIIA